MSTLDRLLLRLDPALCDGCDRTRRNVVSRDGRSQECARCRRRWPPSDVVAWLDETYTDEGVRVWLRAYLASGRRVRRRMERIARTPSGGT